MVENVGVFTVALKTKYSITYFPLVTTKVLQL